MIIFVILNNILVTFGIKFSYSEDDQDGGGKVIPLFSFFIFIYSG